MCWARRIGSRLTSSPPRPSRLSRLQPPLPPPRAPPGVGAPGVASPPSRAMLARLVSDALDLRLLAIFSCSTPNSAIRRGRSTVYAQLPTACHRAAEATPPSPSPAVAAGGCDCLNLRQCSARSWPRLLLGPPAELGGGGGGGGGGGMGGASGGAISGGGAMSGGGASGGGADGVAAAVAWHVGGGGAGVVRIAGGASAAGAAAPTDTGALSPAPSAFGMVGVVCG